MIAPQMPLPFLTLNPAASGQFTLEVTPALSVGRGDNRFLFGGAGLAAAVMAMEQVSGRPAIWATAQYLSYARPGTTVTITTTLPTMGKYTTQARATISAGDKEVLTATAALGERTGPSDQWAAFPDVPCAADCEEVSHWSDEGNLGGRFRFRPARGFFGDVPPGRERSADGRLLFWIRPKEDLVIDRVVLAVIADFVTPGIRNAMGRSAGGNSLDNTIRYAALTPSEWVLCDVAIESIASGIAHGSMRIFAENGALLAIASQSMILRVRD